MTNEERLEPHGIVEITILDDGILTDEVIERLNGVIDHAEDVGCSAILLRLIGKTNSAELVSWPGPLGFKRLGKWERVMRRIERMQIACFASIENSCSRLALEFLLVADLRLAVAGSKIRCIGTSGAFVPTMALYRLTRQIGEPSARLLALARGEISLDRAFELQLVDILVEANCEMSEWVRGFLRGVDISEFSIRRRLIQETSTLTYEDALGVFLAACERASRRDRIA